MKTYIVCVHYKLYNEDLTYVKRIVVKSPNDIEMMAYSYMMGYLGSDTFSKAQKKSVEWMSVDGIKAVLSHTLDA